MIANPDSRMERPSIVDPTELYVQREALPPFTTPGHTIIPQPSVRFFEPSIPSVPHVQNQSFPSAPVQPIPLKRDKSGLLSKFRKGFIDPLMSIIEGDEDPEYSPFRNPREPPTQQMMILNQNSVSPKKKLFREPNEEARALKDRSVIFQSIDQMSIMHNENSRLNNSSFVVAQEGQLGPIIAPNTGVPLERSTNLNNSRPLISSQLQQQTTVIQRPGEPLQGYQPLLHGQNRNVLQYNYRPGDIFAPRVQVSGPGPAQPVVVNPLNATFSARPLITTQMPPAPRQINSYR